MNILPRKIFLVKELGDATSIIPFQMTMKTAEVVTTLSEILRKGATQLWKLDAQMVNISQVTTRGVLKMLATMTANAAHRFLKAVQSYLFQSQMADV